MQIRSKAYAQVISQLRALHRLILPNEDPSAQEASPVLVFTAVILATLLAILEMDSAGLPSPWLMGEAFPVGP